MISKTTLLEIRNKPIFQFYWFISMTIIGLLLSSLFDKYLGKATELDIYKGISLAEIIIAFIIVIISVLSIISIASVYNDYMKRVQSVHENCMEQVVNAHENCKTRAYDAHTICENHIRSLRTTVLYQEEYSSNDGDSLGYRILAEYVSKAENRILQVTSAPSDNFEEDDYPSRREYFKTLLNKINEKKGSRDFEFGRIHQVHNINDPLPALDEGYKEFYKSIITFPTYHKNIGLLKVKTNRLYGFTIIDNKYLIIQMSGLKNENIPVASGIFIFTDNHGSSIIKDFERYYGEIIRSNQTNPIDSKDIKAN